MRNIDEQNQQRLFSRRLLVLGGMKLALLSTLGGRLYYLQVTENEKYRVLADENRIDFRLLPPLRGRILDRHGIELANNRRNYRVLLIPERSKNLNATLDGLAELIDLPEHERRRVLREAERNRKFVPITVIENLSWDAFSRINVHSPELAGIEPDIGETRAYPFVEIFSHVVGYVGAVNERELGADPDPLLQLPGFRIGKNGIEAVHDRNVRGKAGSSQVEVNVVGREIRELAREEGIPGDDIGLTIDADLHRYAYHRLGEESGSVCLMDVHSGEVLALVSAPGFDPNWFNVGLTNKQWHELSNNPRGPLNNKAIVGQYPPGSTFKMVTALAALDAGVVTPDTVVNCSGRLSLGSHNFHCWKKEGHGGVDMIAGISNSCDLYFYELARKVGIDRLAQMARRMGLGTQQGIDLPNEKPGLVPDTKWKKKALNQSWHQGETIIAGIGQGYMLTTPLQLCTMTARLANGGIGVVPQLIKSVGSTPVAATKRFENLGLNRNHLDVVLRGMWTVSNVPGGTAFRSRIDVPGWEIAGKTGTAQVRRISKAERLTGVRKNEDLPWEQRDHALFVCFAPYEQPRFAVSVIVEHGGGGSKTAAPIARDVMIEALRRDPQANQIRQQKASQFLPHRHRHLCGPECNGELGFRSEWA